MRGVRLNKATGKWQVRCRKYLGEFETEAQAIEKRRRAEMEYDGYIHVEPKIAVRDGVARVPIMGAHGRHIATAFVDEEDVPLIKKGRWSLVKSGYAVQRRDNCYVYMHRLIQPYGEVCDHIDGNRLNNRRANLRSCKPHENSRNRRNLSKNNSSGIKGVSRPSGSDKRWRARIWYDRREIYLGQFKTREEALAAYWSAAQNLHGEFASVAVADSWQPIGAVAKRVVEKIGGK